MNYLIGNCSTEFGKIMKRTLFTGGSTVGIYSIFVIAMMVTGPTLPYVSLFIYKLLLSTGLWGGCIGATLTANAVGDDISDRGGSPLGLTLGATTFCLQVSDFGL